MNSKVIRFDNGSSIETLPDTHIVARSGIKCMFPRKNGKSVMSMRKFVDLYCPDDLTDEEKIIIYNWLYGGEQE